MTSGRVRLIPFFLVALAIVAMAVLLPDAVGAQGNCCSCSWNGTNCSACCYSDQTPSCVVEFSGSVSYCACTCPLVGGGGGGAGCSIRLDSRTTVMGLDRGSDRGAKLADHQLGGGLLNSGERREGFFNFEEWALVSSTGEVLRASNVDFAERVQNAGDRFRPRGKGGASTVLVIEDADHPHNSREIAVPTVAPIDFDAGLSASLAGQEMWFRAEVGEDGVVDQMILLNVPDAFAAESINQQLRDRVSLRYTDAKRHRVVVFGSVRANTKGHLVMTRSRVILPKCCCYGRHCV
jgi:hypothetical protein